MKESFFRRALAALAAGTAIGEPASAQEQPQTAIEGINLEDPVRVFENSTSTDSFSAMQSEEIPVRRPEEHSVIPERLMRDNPLSVSVRQGSIDVGVVTGETSGEDMLGVEFRTNSRRE